MLTVDLDRLALAPGRIALDLGCGQGRHAHAIALRGDASVVGLDMAHADLTTARNGFAFVNAPDGWSLVQGDALRLPFQDAAFDGVICSEVLEHLLDYQGALDEIARVLRPGGVLAVSVPRGWPEAICWRLSEEYRTTPGGHVRIFKAPQLAADVVARGFELLARHGAHALHSPYWWLRCAVRRADDHPLVRLYKQFLEWDITTRPRFVRLTETLLNPVLGKSVVMYFRRAGAPT